MLCKLKILWDCWLQSAEPTVQLKVVIGRRDDKVAFASSEGASKNNFENESISKYKKQAKPGLQVLNWHRPGLCYAE